jgi:hypothetical protein
VEQYNEKRRLLLSKCQELANSVAAWNESERQQWKQYRDSCNAFEREELARFQEAARAYELEYIAENTRLRGILDGFRAGQKQQVLERLDYILGSIEWPLSMSRVWQADYDEAQHILIVEIELPNVVHRPPIKFVEQRIGLVARPLNQTERRELIPQIHPAITLRAALEIFRNDESSVVQLLALNGWVSFHHPHTGLDTRAYTAPSPRFNSRPCTRGDNSRWMLSFSRKRFNSRPCTRGDVGVHAVAGVADVSTHAPVQGAT